MQEKDVIEAIEDLKEEISEKQSYIELIESIDFTKPVDENTWHQICETPLRSSDLLAKLVKNTFPEAENIVVHCNYVYFELMGFKVQIPTSRRKGINVDTLWYYRDRGVPTEIYRTKAAESIKKYLEALDSGAGWYECARHRLRHTNKFTLFCAWWFKYKWNKDNREEWEKILKEDEENFEKRVQAYYQNRKEMKEKVQFLVNELLPVLDKFSTVHGKYNEGQCGCYTIEQLREFENI